MMKFIRDNIRHCVAAALFGLVTLQGAIIAHEFTHDVDSPAETCITCQTGLNPLALLAKTVEIIPVDVVASSIEVWPEAEAVFEVMPSPRLIRGPPSFLTI